MKSLSRILLIVTMLFAAGALGLGVAQADSSYTVQSGDTLYGIAGQMGIASGQQSDWVDKVVSMNGLSGPDQLSLGQVLKIPGSSSSSSTAKSNTPATSSGSSTVSANTTYASTYTVQSGDTLYTIAASLGYADQAAVFTQLVVQLNGLSGPDQLTVGQVLKLPVPSGSSSSAPSGTTTTTTTTTNTTTTAQPATATSTTPASTTSTTPAFNQASIPARSAACQSSAAATCDYGSSDQLVIPSMNEGDSSRCGSVTINATVNVYDVGGDGAMGIPVADCDVVRENFSAFPGYGGYPGSGGTTVLAGHVDYHPHYEAVFWNLRQVAPGTEIDYVNKDGKTIRYSVDWAQAVTDPNYDWAGLAKSSGTESLVLITCDGTFNPDTHEYDRRFVAHATKIS